MSAGRSGEQAAQGLTQNLHKIGIKTERLKQVLQQELIKEVSFLMN